MAASFEGKTILITGTGGGQGRAAALRFALAGAQVVGCDVKEEGNRETAAMVREAGGSIVTMQPIDLGDPETARRWVEDAAALNGRIDVLYNNASAARFLPIESFTVEAWQFTVRNELDLVFYATRFAWPHLQKRGGVIINVASVAGMSGAPAGGTAHAATKGAVIAMTRSTVGVCKFPSSAGTSWGERLNRLVNSSIRKRSSVFGDEFRSRKSSEFSGCK